MIPITVSTANGDVNQAAHAADNKRNGFVDGSDSADYYSANERPCKLGYREDKSLIRVEARISRFPCGKERNKHEYSQISEYRHNLVRLNIVLVELGRCVGRVIELIDFCSEILLFLFPRLCLRRFGHNGCAAVWAEARLVIYL